MYRRGLGDVLRRQDLLAEERHRGAEPECELVRGCGAGFGLSDDDMMARKGPTNKIPSWRGWRGRLASFGTNTDFLLRLEPGE